MHTMARSASGEAPLNQAHVALTANTHRHVASFKAKGGTWCRHFASQTPAAHTAPQPSATQGMAENERKGISV